VGVGKGVDGGDKAEPEEDALGEEEGEDEDELEEASDGLVDGNGAGSTRIPCIVG
jgi:hypothetical protein